MAFDYTMPIYEKGNFIIHCLCEEYYSYDWQVWKGLILVNYINDDTFRFLVACVGILCVFNVIFSKLASMALFIELELALVALEEDSDTLLG